MLNLERANITATMLQENGFLPNVKVFLLNKASSRLESEDDFGNYKSTS
jgi:hypothetical protein